SRDGLNESVSRLLCILVVLRSLLTFRCLAVFFSFFFNDPATTEIYTLSLHDALPISEPRGLRGNRRLPRRGRDPRGLSSPLRRRDRKSTRLNSSHVSISYAVFCLKKKKQRDQHLHRMDDLDSRTDMHAIIVDILSVAL